MITKTIFLRNCTLNTGLRVWSSRCYSTASTEKAASTETVDFDINSAEEVPRYLDITTEEVKADILKKRLKSGLNDNHRRVINGVKPYDENMAWFHLTTRYKKRMLGRFGMKDMDVPVGVAWPTQEEIEEKLLVESIAYPKSLQERWRDIEEHNSKADEEIRLREEQITKSLALVGKWQKELQAKLAKKEADIQAAKERKARMVEEVRRQFGFAIDPRDERFKTLLEQKEKEDKKRKKEAKKKDKAAKFLTAMMEKANNPSTAEPTKPSDPPAKT